MQIKSTNKEQNQVKLKRTKIIIMLVLSRCKIIIKVKMAYSQSDPSCYAPAPARAWNAAKRAKYIISEILFHIMYCEMVI